MPMRTKACGAPDFSMSRACCGCMAGSAVIGAGRPPAAQPPSVRSSARRSSSSPTSPATTSSAFRGRQLSAWKRTRSSRRMVFTEASVPIGQWP